MFLRFVRSAAPTRRPLHLEAGFGCPVSQPDNGLTSTSPSTPRSGWGGSWPALLMAYPTLFLLDPTKEGCRGLRSHHLEL